jgi:V/A-type H+-transporting ATPase subunit I
MLRPRPCHWFELVTAREGLAPALESLARSGAVELQVHERRAAPLVVGGAERPLARFHELAKTYGSHWPATRGAAATHVSDPAATLRTRLAQLEAWRSAADPLIATQERLSAQAQTLGDLAQLLQADAALLPQPALLAGAGQFKLGIRIYALPPQTPAFEVPADVMQLLIAAGHAPHSHDFVLLLGRGEALPALDTQFAALQARRVDWPGDLGGSVAEAAQALALRQRQLEQQADGIRSSLAALAQGHDLMGALADIEVVEWLIRHGSELAATDRLIWVTGWTTANDASTLCAPLHAQGLRCVLQFPEAPAGAEPPSVLSNPPWVRAFESFSRLLGQPGATEADPSALLALVAPLLFGFMFGDVGQGAVLVAAGWLLRRRAPMLAMLIPGGLMAMVFGLLFGTVFAREDLIPALWMHPLHDPVGLLAAAVALGAAILLGGLALQALEAAWRHEARRWWACDAGLVLAYVGVLAAVVDRRALWLAPAGAVWFVAGSTALGVGSRLAALATGLAQFVEHALQLLVNTVSFARVGAFALAHAGLSLAVTGVALASGRFGYWLVLLLGNLLILLLEGLVVGIQTTRLLLFEFFVRFLQGTGRAFKPLPPPYVQTSP